MPSLSEWQKEISEWAIEKGWRGKEDDRTFGEEIALMHSELSEALEEYRQPVVGQNAFVWHDRSGKPCGIGIELADCIIRILDTAEHYGMDMDRLIAEKMAYNRGRPHRHGGKRL